MKGFDPHLIKWLIIGLVFLGRAVVAMNRKRKKSNDALRPPQSAPAPTLIAPPSMTQGLPKSRKAPKGQTQDADSPWSNTKGPFD